MVVESEVSKHDDAQFRRDLSAKLRTALFELSPRARWSDAMRRAAGVLKPFSLGVDPSRSVFAGLDIDSAEGFADHGDLAMDLTDVFVALGEAAQSLGRGVVLLLDEVQFLASGQLEALIGALHKVVQRKLPVTLVGAGLPQIAELAGDAKSYAQRLLKFPSIGYLSAGDAAKALAEPAATEGTSFDADALSRALEITGGYPYFIQELGYAVWPLAKGNRVTEQDIDDAEVMGRTSPQLGPTRAELIAMGLLYTPEHGYAGFTVPHFDKFMMRAIPNLVLPPRRVRRSGSNRTESG